MEILGAFVGGLLSFVSPCFFPLIPVYVSLITGISLKDSKIASQKVMFHSLVFVLGFSLSFSVLGASAAFLGKLIKTFKNEVMFVGGVLLVILGLNLMGVLKIPPFLMERRIDVLKFRLPRYVFPLLFGIFFAISWTPCIGPILAGILLVASSYDVRYGAFLLFLYSLGIGIPFFISSIFISHFLKISSRFRRFLKGVEVATGMALVVLGVVFSLNKLKPMSFQLLDLTRIEEKIAALSAKTGKLKGEPPFERRKDMEAISAEIYKRIFSGDYKSVNHLLPTESQFVVVNFWATYCKPCIKTIACLVLASSKYEISVIGIADDSPENVKNFLSYEYELNFPVFVLSDILADDLYVPHGLPETLFFYNGKLVGLFRGTINDDIVRMFLNLDFSFMER